MTIGPALSRLEKMPQVLVNEIASYLSGSDLNRLSCVSSSLNQDIEKLRIPLLKRAVSQLPPKIQEFLRSYRFSIPRTGLPLRAKPVLNWLLTVLKVASAIDLKLYQHNGLCKSLLEQAAKEQPGLLTFIPELKKLAANLTLASLFTCSTFIGDQRLYDACANVLLTKRGKKKHQKAIDFHAIMALAKQSNLWSQDPGGFGDYFEHYPPNTHIEKLLSFSSPKQWGFLLEGAIESKDLQLVKQLLSIHHHLPIESELIWKAAKLVDSSIFECLLDSPHPKSEDVLESALRACISTRNVTTFTKLFNRLRPLPQPLLENLGAEWNYYERDADYHFSSRFTDPMDDHKRSAILQMIVTEYRKFVPYVAYQPIVEEQNAVAPPIKNNALPEIFIPQVIPNDLSHPRDRFIKQLAIFSLMLVLTLLLHNMMRPQEPI